MKYRPIRIHKLPVETEEMYGAFSPDRLRLLTRVLSGGRDRTIRLWEVNNGRCLRAIEGLGADVQCLVCHSDQRRLLSCARDIRLWDSETGECLKVFHGHTDTVRSVIWSQDEKHVL
jgi:WD40 repeat protein